MLSCHTNLSFPHLPSEFPTILIIIYCSLGENTSFRSGRHYRAGYRSLSYTAFDNYITKIQFCELVSEEPQRVHTQHIAKAIASLHSASILAQKRNAAGSPNSIRPFVRMLKAATAYTCTDARAYVYLPPLRTTPMIRIDRERRIIIMSTRGKQGECCNL